MPYDVLDSLAEISFNRTYGILTFKPMQACRIRKVWKISIHLVLKDRAVDHQTVLLYHALFFKREAAAAMTLLAVILDPFEFQNRSLLDKKCYRYFLNQWKPCLNVSS